MRIASTTSEASVLAELGTRAQQHRIGMNLTQAELASRAGVSQRTVERLEAGSSVQLEKLVRIFRALRLSANFDQLAPEATIRPIQLAGSKTEARRRASKRRNAPPTSNGWVWGDKK